MYFESVFIKPNNFCIDIYNIKLSKKFMKIACFLASKVGRPLKKFSLFILFNLVSKIYMLHIAT